MSTTTTPVIAMSMADVIDAMRSIQSEDDRWKLAEALHQQVPTGVKGFQEIIDAATAAGVAGNLKVNTLRLYRDTAVRWPSDKRVANVSFSAHREAMVLPTIDAAAKMLGNLAANNGAAHVTVASVRKAIAVQQGKPLPATGTGTGTGKVTAKTVDVLADVKAGAPTLIAAITPATTVPDLDSIHAGLSKAIAHVERLRAKAARKATATSKTAATPATASTSKAQPAPKGAPKKPQGDLRGL